MNNEAKINRIIHAATVAHNENLKDIIVKSQNKDIIVGLLLNGAVYTTGLFFSYFTIMYFFG